MCDKWLLPKRAIMPPSSHAIRLPPILPTSRSTPFGDINIPDPKFETIHVYQFVFDDYLVYL